MYFNIIGVMIPAVHAVANIATASHMYIAKGKNAANNQKGRHASQLNGLAIERLVICLLIRNNDATRYPDLQMHSGKFNPIDGHGDGSPD